MTKTKQQSTANPSPTMVCRLHGTGDTRLLTTNTFSIRCLAGELSSENLGHAIDAAFVHGRYAWHDGYENPGITEAAASDIRHTCIVCLLLFCVFCRCSERFLFLVFTLKTETVNIEKGRKILTETAKNGNLNTKTFTETTKKLKIESRNEIFHCMRFNIFICDSTAVLKLSARNASINDLHMMASRRE
jgi:hypothetical protein